VNTKQIESREIMNTIMEYVRDRKNAKVGVLVATKVEGGGKLRGPIVRFGWSRTNTKAGDVFSKDQGLRMAMGRAQKSRNMFDVNSVFENIPQSMDKQFKNFTKRAERYFKDEVIETKYNNE